MAKSRLILLATLIAFAGMAVLLWRADRRADKAEQDAGLASARVLSELFEQTSALQVARLRGEAIARSATDGCLGLCTVTQSTRAPYEVLYTIDLSRVPTSAYRWNADKKTMIVTIPPVAPGQPNVDFSRAQIRQNGVWISRRSNAALQTAAAKSLRAATEAAASRPDNMMKAQENARQAVEAMVAAPLKAAGLGTVRVVVKLPGEDRPAGLDRERWDESRPLSEVLNQAN